MFLYLCTEIMISVSFFCGFKKKRKEKKDKKRQEKTRKDKKRQEKTKKDKKRQEKTRKDKTKRQNSLTDFENPKKRTRNETK